MPVYSRSSSNALAFRKIVTPVNHIAVNMILLKVVGKLLFKRFFYSSPGGWNSLRCPYEEALAECDIELEDSNVAGQAQTVLIGLKCGVSSRRLCFVKK